MARRRRISCGSCGAFVRPVPIVYGYPLPETEERANRGELILGGCFVEPDDPRFACPQCGEPMVSGGGRSPSPAIPNRLDGDGAEERIHRMYAAIAARIRRELEGPRTPA